VANRSIQADRRAHLSGDAPYASHKRVCPMRVGKGTARLGILLGILLAESRRVRPTDRAARRPPASGRTGDLRPKGMGRDKGAERRKSRKGCAIGGDIVRLRPIVDGEPEETSNHA